MEIKAVGRTRDRKGKVIKRTLKDYVNCLHGSLGGGNMGCYIAIPYENPLNKRTVTMEGRQYLIRRLTPKEAFRLMGVKDTDIDKIQQTGMCKTHQYELAGNSIVVDVLSFIFHNLFINPSVVSSENSRGGVKISYIFPKPFKLEKTLKDVLEPHVDESYYLTERTLKGLRKHNENHRKKGTGFIFRPKTENDIAGCLRANAALCPTDNTVIQPYKPIENE